jgi:Leucine-rich repeat (LRR) protein
MIARLSLAGTHVTIKGINSVIDGGRFHRLNIGDLNIDDESLAHLSVSSLNELVLKGNPITDKSIQHIATVRSLDLSETKCVGTGLGQLTSTVSLVLDGTSVDDAAIKQLLSSNKVLRRLSLRNTQVTDSILPTLQQTPSLTELEIGDGQITREGLLAVAFAPTERLALNSKKFDANLFAEWHPSIRRLDMSDSGVSNADVANLKNVRGLAELSLAHCNISDACLPKLVALGVGKIDLTGTQVTASAVAKLFPKTTAVYLSAEQCRPEQLAAPDPVGSLRIGVRLNINSRNY